MHWNVEQILWALVLSAHLVLLVVLMGRDRLGRFPWFSAAIAFSTVHLIADHLLHGKLTTVAFYWQSYTGIVIEAILGIFVLIELARRVFSNLKAGVVLNGRGWLGWTLVTVGVSVAGVWLWGPWPAWKAITADPKQTPLLLLVLTALKSQLFLALLTVQIGLLIRIFGKRFGSRFKSHTQQIMLGLSTYALGFLAVQTTTDIIKHTVHLTSRAEYERILKLFANFDNARFALWLIVLIWWIVWLWRDESPVFRLTTDQAPLEIEPATLETGLPPELREELLEDNREGDPDFRD